MKKKQVKIKLELTKQECAVLKRVIKYYLEENGGWGILEELNKELQ